MTAARHVAAAADPVAAVLEAHERDQVIALRTSGTTSRPRSVVRTTRSWVLELLPARLPAGGDRPACPRLVVRLDAYPPMPGECLVSVNHRPICHLAEQVGSDDEQQCRHEAGGCRILPPFGVVPGDPDEVVDVLDAGAPEQMRSDGTVDQIRRIQASHGNARRVWSHRRRPGPGDVIRGST